MTTKPGEDLTVYNNFASTQYFESVAKARKLTLVTHNTPEFPRVPSLKVEEWKGAIAREASEVDQASS